MVDQSIFLLFFIIYSHFIMEIASDHLPTILPSLFTLTYKNLPNLFQSYLCFGRVGIKFEFDERKSVGKKVIYKYRNNEGRHTV